MQKRPEKRKQRQKCTHMCAAMCRWIRLQMCFDPRDMYRTLELPRRTYQDYESGSRSIPAHIAARIRELYRRDLEFMAGIGTRVDQANLERFGSIMIQSERETEQ